MRPGHVIALGILCVAAALAVEPVRESPFTVGVCTHFSQGKGLLPVNLALIRQAGITAIRDETGWSGVETEKGKLRMPEAWDRYVRRAAASGLETLLILDYGNKFYDNGDKPTSSEALEAFARYAEFVVRTFRGVVKHYEVWNEYDIKIGGGSPGSAENYAALLKKVYPRIKAVDPSITVYGGAMTPGGVRNGWLERMLAAGALQYLDVVSIHTYNYGRPANERTPEAWAGWMQKVEELIARYNDGKPAPLYVTEMGWPSQNDARGTPPETSAAYLVRMYLLARSMPFLKGIWWYDFQDDGWNASYNEDNFGLVRADLTPKPAYFALDAIAPLVGGASYAGRVDVGDPSVFILKFKDASKRDTWAIWSTHEDADIEVTLTSPAGARKRLLSIRKVGAPAYERPWGSRDWEKRNARPIDDQISIVVHSAPWLISGELDGVRVSIEPRPSPRGRPDQEDL